MAISTTDRIQALENIAVQFGRHLTTVPGVVLTSSQRIGIAEYARLTVFESVVCLAPGTSLFRTIRDMKWNDSRNNDDCIIRTIVHTTLNYIQRIDGEWYKDCLDAISTSGLVPESSHEEEYRQYLVYSAFCEIVALACMSHCIHMAFQLMGRPVPPIPSAPTTDLQPTRLDWSLILKRPPSRSGTAAWYFTNADIHVNSHEYCKRISDRGRQAMKHYGDVFHPAVAMGFCAEDVAMMSEIESVYYIPAKVRDSFCEL